MPVFTDEQVMIADSIAAFFEARGGVDRVRRLRDSSAPLDKVCWRDAADQGWLGILASERGGGLGLGVADAMVAMRAAGRFLPFEPFAGAMAAAHCLGRIVPEHEALSSLLSGELIVVPVIASAAAKQVPDIAAADRFLLCCMAGEAASLRIVARGTPGLAIDASATVDGGSIGTLTYNGPIGDLLAESGHAAGAVRDLRDVTRLLRAAELVSIADEAFQLTVEYLKTRKQFGVPIGSFQALQHRAASLYVAIASAEALAFEAARAFGGPRQSFAAAAAVTKAAATALAVCKEAIQMHGAIGFTDEFRIGLYLKRTMALAATEGGAARIMASRHLQSSEQTGISL